MGVEFLCGHRGQCRQFRMGGWKNPLELAVVLAPLKPMNKEMELCLDEFIHNVIRILEVWGGKLWSNCKGIFFCEMEALGARKITLAFDDGHRSGTVEIEA